MSTPDEVLLAMSKPIDAIYLAIASSADWPTISQMINNLPAHITMSKRITHQLWMQHNCVDCGFGEVCEECGSCKSHCTCEEDREP